MKRKSLIEAVSPEVRDFIEAGTPKPQFVHTQKPKKEGEGSPARVPEPTPTALEPEEEKQASAPAREQGAHQPTGEIPLPMLIPQTYRLPQRLVEDLARAAIERKIKRRKPWSQQDIVAEAIKEWLRKHVSK